MVSTDMFTSVWDMNAWSWGMGQNGNQDLELERVMHKLP